MNKLNHITVPCDSDAWQEIIKDRYQGLPEALRLAREAEMLYRDELLESYKLYGKSCWAQLP